MFDITKLETSYATSVGYVSCVGCMGNKYPKNYGNYFSLVTSKGKQYEIANFWYENLEYLLENNVVSYPLEIKVLDKKWAIIHDTRIPDNFYSETSYRAPTKYWSIKQLAQRRRKIETGEIKISGYIDDPWDVPPIVLKEKPKDLE
jgi:hypothetical protein